VRRRERRRGARQERQAFAGGERFAGGFLQKPVEQFAGTRGEHHFIPDRVHAMARRFEHVCLFLQAEFEHIAPGARAQELGWGSAVGYFPAQGRPVLGQFVSGGFDPGGGGFAGAERLLVVLFRAFLLFAGRARRADMRGCFHGKRLLCGTGFGRRIRRRGNG